MSQSSPGSLTGASSADATVMTMPPEPIATGSDARIGNAKRTLKRFTSLQDQHHQERVLQDHQRGVLRELRSRMQKGWKKERFNSLKNYDQPGFS